MQKRTVWVTGASRGIGAAIARRFAQGGDRLVLHYFRSEAEAEQLAQTLSELGAQCLLVRADLSSQSEIVAAHRKILETFGPVDVLVNNGGFAQQKLFTDISAEEWQAMFDVHVNGAFHCCQAVLPHMISEKSGHIVNIASIWGMVGASCEVHYSAAKAALIGMSKALAKELAPSNVQVNCVAPGVIETDMLRCFPEEDRALIAQEIPMGRFGRPEEMAELVYFLASNAANYISGQVISPNGAQIT